MCRRGLALVVVLLAIGVPTALHAQDANVRTSEEELLQRVQELVPQVEDAQARFARVEDRRREVAASVMVSSMDTIGFGQIRVITPTDNADLARELFREVLDERFVGVEDRAAFAKEWITFQRATPKKPIYVDALPQRVEVGSLTSRADTKRAIGDAIMAVLFEETAMTKTGIAAWGVTGALYDPYELASLIYREVATTASHLAPKCLAGEAMACWTLIGLDIEGERFLTWYEPHERRALVATPRNRYWGDRSLSPVVDRCIDESDIAACDEVLASGHHRDLNPLRHSSRNLMIWLALEAGGPTAWARLLEDPEMPAGDALRYASGLSSEELASRWREVVVDARPEIQAGLGWIQLLTAMWILLFVAFTRRSTRWRLG